MFRLLPLYLLLVVQIGQAWSGKASKATTTFHVPATNAPGYCETYDLSKLAAVGGINFTNLDGYMYTLSVGANLDKSKLASACQAKAASPAYQFSAKYGCFALGNLSSALVVSDN